ncbi:MAG: hypothetical protein EP338_12730 [Bacteroidetes bacterium]|nr:MAG: hypothetical protein EP338_12730 [Bacteroidota bacterium]
MTKTLKITLLLGIGIFLFSCSEDIPVPKPPTYLRLDLPDHQYEQFKEVNCNYSFDFPPLYTISSPDDSKEVSCNKDINLGPLNGMMYFSFIEMDKPLAEYVNYAINKVDEHKIMATAIEDSTIIRKDDRVYGTFFELQGDVASPFQFYLTDSTKHFVSGVVYLNKAPNYDSLRPSLEYLKKDLFRMVQSFKWN